MQREVGRLLKSFLQRPGAARTARLEELGVRWLAEHKAAVKESTYIKYETIWRRHIRPTLGGCTLTGITTATVDGFCQGMLRDGLAPKTVRDVLVVLDHVLAYGAGNGWPQLASVRVNYPRVPRKPMRVLSREEQTRFVEYLCRDLDCCKFGVMLALSTGIRLGELCALRWQNISLEHRCIIIDATMQRLKVLDDTSDRRTHVVVTSPKTDAAVRAIPISDTVAALCRAVGVRAPSCYVLTGTEAYMEPRAVQYHLKKYTCCCGLQGVHFHTLRHTFATRSVEVGFDLKSLSEILGHADTSITLDRYVHSSMAFKRNNMDKLAQVGL